MTATPSFTNIPGSGIVAPIFAFEVNSGGLYEAKQAFFLVGHGDGTGTAAANTPYPINGAVQNADALFGPNSMVREMARTALRNGPALPLYEIMVAATGVAAVWTQTLTSWTGTGIAAIEIEGERISVPVGSTDTPTTIATALAAAINNYWNQLTGKKLGVTASSSAGVLTTAARWAGIIGNSIVHALPANVSGNVLTSSTWTLAAATAGTGAPTLTTALAALGDNPADIIVSPWSDSTSLAAYTALLNDTSGRWAYNRQSYGHVVCVFDGTTSAVTTAGAGYSDRHITMIPNFTAAPLKSPDWTTASAIAAKAAVWLFDYTTGNCSRSQAWLVVLDVGAPYASSSFPGWPTRNSLLQNGVSTWRVDRSGNVCIDKLITMAQLGPQGQPDVTFRDIQKIFQTEWSLQYMRTRLSSEQGNKGIADTNPGSLASIATTRDIAGTIVNAYTQLSKWGVLDAAPAFAQNINVVRNGSNPDRVDVYAPLVPIAPLDIIAANATIWASAAQMPVAA